MPTPITDLRHIFTVPLDISTVFSQPIPNELFYVGRALLDPRNVIDYRACKMETIELVAYRHIEGRGRGAFLTIAMHVQLSMIRSPVRQAMN